MEYVGRMNWVDKHWAWGLGGMLLALVARADVTETASNPYEVIIERNAFGLKPLPQVTNPPTNPPPPANVKFTGIHSDSTSKTAFFVVQSPSGKTPQLFTIPEHEKQGDIEVVEINDKDNSVKILNAGSPMELNFKDNGLPTPMAPVVPGIPINPGAPLPGIVPAPGTPPPGIKTAIATPTGVAPSDAMAARYGVQPANATAAPALRTIPARNVRTPPVEPQGQSAGTPVDPVLQRRLMEAQKAAAEQAGVRYPPLPPLPGQTGR